MQQQEAAPSSLQQEPQFSQEPQAGPASPSHAVHAAPAELMQEAAEAMHQVCHHDIVHDYCLHEDHLEAQILTNRDYSDNGMVICVGHVNEGSCQ